VLDKDIRWQNAVYRRVYHSTLILLAYILGKPCRYQPHSPLILLSRLTRTQDEVKEVPIYASTVCLLPSVVKVNISELLYSRSLSTTVHMERLSSTERLRPSRTVESRMYIHLYWIPDWCSANTRLQPTVSVFEKRMAALEGGEAALATSFVPAQLPYQTSFLINRVGLARQPY
jgi:hypothetical protein